MGRQINFYMSDKVRNDFTNFLKAEGYIFLPDAAFESLYTLKNIEDEYSVCLYKETFGKIEYKQVKGTNKYRIDKSYSPVIEYWIPHIKQEDKSVRSGRLWLTSQGFYDANADRAVISGDYNKLVRWIKKNVPYQAVDGYSQKMYISDELADMICGGYILR